MIGFLITTGVGVVTFKLGMDAQRMKSEGKSANEIIASMPGNALEILTVAARGCCSALAKIPIFRKKKDCHEEQGGKDGKNGKTVEVTTTAKVSS